MKIRHHCDWDKKKQKWNKYDTEKPMKLDWLDFRSLSSSGKTIYNYFECPKCKRIFRKGKRIHKF